MYINIEFFEISYVDEIIVLVFSFVVIIFLVN